MQQHLNNLQHNNKIMNINKQDIEKAQQAASTRWGNWIKYVIGAIIGALAAAGYITVTGCGHNVTITPDHTEICKNGSCLVLDKNGQSITYHQNAPEPPATAEQTPVINTQEK